MTRASGDPIGRVHVIGAGMAGLAAAVDLAARGVSVTLYEATAHAGGRCRSFYDSELGVRIDNGNHLLLSGNSAALDYIGQTSAIETFEQPPEAAIPFVDLATGTAAAGGERWTIRPSRGAVPWWLLFPSRRVPGTRARDYLAGLRLRRAPAEATVAATLNTQSVLYRRLWQPLAVAALNTAASEASARLLGRIVEETLGRGAAACRPLMPREGLSESLVDPALSFLSRHGCDIRFGARLKAVDHNGERASALAFDDAVVPLGPKDTVVLAVPAAIAARLVPGLVVPDDYAPILNAHFRYATTADMPLLLGVVGGTAEWIFRKREVISVTVSAADHLIDEPAEELRDLLWADVGRALGLPPAAAAEMPPARIVKERRATFRATPAQLRRRPAATTHWNNFHLAGDYVETGLPATIEAAIRSGFAAASHVRDSSGRRRSTASVSVPKQPPQQPKPFLPHIEDCPRVLP